MIVSSLSLLPVPLWPRVVVPIRIPSKSQLLRNNYIRNISMNIHWMWFPNHLAENNTVWVDIPLKSINQSILKYYELSLTMENTFPKTFLCNWNLQSVSVDMSKYNKLDTNMSQKLFFLLLSCNQLCIHFSYNRCFRLLPQHYGIVQTCKA